jgi:putative oxidoreductase
MSRPQAWGIALLRVALGVVYVMHGWLGLTGPGPDETARLLVSTGVPDHLGTPVAWYLIVAHVLGGVMLVIGLWTVPAALAQVPLIAGALFVVHSSQGFYMRGIIVDAAAGRAVAGGYEFAMLVLAATLAIALTGAGALSVDDTRRHRPRRFQMP